MEKKIMYRDPREEMMRAFKLICDIHNDGQDDKTKDDNTGMIEFKHLRRMADNYAGRDMTDEEVQNMMNMMDRHSTGHIDEEDFQYVCRHTNMFSGGCAGPLRLRGRSPLLPPFPPPNTTP